MKRSLKLLSVFLFILQNEAVASETAPLSIPSFSFLQESHHSFFSIPPRLPWGIDPFLKVPGHAAAKALEVKFVLNGIFYNESDPMAIVNGVNVREGDSIEDREVYEIGENYTILRKGDSFIEVNMPPIANQESKDRKPSSEELDP